MQKCDYYNEQHNAEDTKAKWHSTVMNRDLAEKLKDAFNEYLDMKRQRLSKIKQNNYILNEIKNT